MIFRAEFTRKGLPAERVTFGAENLIEAMTTAEIFARLFKADLDFTLGGVVDKFPVPPQIELKLYEEN